MPKERLNELLAKLHDELETTGELEDDTREELYAVSDAIRAVLDENPERAALDESSEQLDGILVALEARYPRLSAIVEQVIDTLARIGI